MALMQLTIIPLGTETTSVSSYVATIHKALQAEEMPYTLTDMATIIEGPAETLLPLAARLHELPFTEGAKRVCTQINIDDRRDKIVDLGDKMQSVEKQL